MNSQEEKKWYENEESGNGSGDETRRDGQAATSDSVMDGLMENAWFPAIYADQFGTSGNGLVPDFPEV